MTTTTLPTVPTTTETEPEYDCWRGVPAHIRRAVATEYTWAPDRRGHPRDGAGLCPAQRAGLLLGLTAGEARGCGWPGGAAPRFGGTAAAWHRFMWDWDLGRIAPGALAAALGV